MHAPPLNLVVLATALSVPPAYLVPDDDRLASVMLDLQKLDDAQISRVEALVDDLRYVED